MADEEPPPEEPDEDDEDEETVRVSFRAPKEEKELAQKTGALLEKEGLVEEGTMTAAWRYALRSLYATLYQAIQRRQQQAQQQGQGQNAGQAPVQGQPGPAPDQGRGQT